MKKILALLVFVFTLGASYAGKYDVVEIKTSHGNIYVWLYKNTPGHRANFLKLAESGFYDSTTFHRIIKNFMIQGGDPYTNMPAKKDSIGNGGPGYTLAAEIVKGRIHKRGVLAAARMGDNVNPKRRSSGSQFYIVQGKKFTAAELDAAEKRIAASLKTDFKLSSAARKVYMEQGGAPWLDEQYTAFGEVIQGMDVVDKIAAVKTGFMDKPIQDVRMDVNVLKLSKKQFKQQFGIKPPK